jgi:hypothetical protein
VLRVHVGYSSRCAAARSTLETKNTEPVAPSSTTPTSFPPGLAASAYDPQERLQPRSAPYSVHRQPMTRFAYVQGPTYRESRKERKEDVGGLAEGHLGDDQEVGARRPTSDVREVDDHGRAETRRTIKAASCCLRVDPDRHAAVMRARSRGVLRKKSYTSVSAPGRCSDRDNSPPTTRPESSFSFQFSCGLATASIQST